MCEKWIWKKVWETVAACSKILYMFQDIIQTLEGTEEKILSQDIRYAERDSNAGRAY